MPRIHQNVDRDAMKDFIDEINAQCGRYGYRSQKALGDALGVCQATAGNYLRRPLTIPLGALRTMVKILKPDPGVVLRAVGYTSTDIKRFKNK